MHTQVEIGRGAECGEGLTSGGINVFHGGEFLGVKFAGIWHHSVHFLSYILSSGRFLSTSFISIRLASKLNRIFYIAQYHYEINRKNNDHDDNVKRHP